MVEKNHNDLLFASPQVIESLTKMAADIELIKQHLFGQSNEPEYISGEEARVLLNVSRSTWQKIRDEKRMTFYQIGRKLYVKKDDVTRYIQSHEIKNKNKDIIN